MDTYILDSLNIDFKKVWPYVVHKSKSKYDDVYIGRPSKWGNKYSFQDGNTLAEIKVKSRLEAVCRYQADCLQDPEFMRCIKEELANKVLSCWCVPNLCHGHVLAAIANDGFLK